MLSTQNPGFGRLVAIVVAFFIVVALLRAQAKDNAIVELPQNQLSKYAAFAQLDSSVAEMSFGTLTVRLMKSGGDVPAKIDDAATDVASAEAFVQQLEAMDLTDAERAALTRFKVGWRELLQMHHALTGSGEVSQAQLLAYWEKAAALNAMTDGVLQAIATGEETAAE
ncbi:MAG: hypothetical protein AAF899_10685 [Pseudomonadota bacterium]